MNYYLKFDLFYNIYCYKGLFFGFIIMVFIVFIDVVFELEEYSYIFFCVCGDGSGYYNFVEILKEYKQNVV